MHLLQSGFLALRGVLVLKQRVVYLVQGLVVDLDFNISLQFFFVLVCVRVLQRFSRQQSIRVAVA